MISPQRLTARSVLGTCVGGLGVISLGGGLVIAAVESIPYAAGVWLVFNTITTIGFTDGPSTALGQLVAVCAFVTGAVCWFGIVSVAVEVGLSRFEHDALVREALRPLAARRGPRLFHNN
jgi:hypothetical protein